MPRCGIRWDETPLDIVRTVSTGGTYGAQMGDETMDPERGRGWLRLGHRLADNRQGRQNRRTLNRVSRPEQPEAPRTELAARQPDRADDPRESLAAASEQSKAGP
jgi:hypothetical protein